MGRDVGVAIHVGGEGGGGVDGIEGHCVVEVGGPGAGTVGFDDRVAGGVVAGYVVREAWEAVGELGFVAGSGVRHGDGGVACLSVCLSVCLWGRGSEDFYWGFEWQ